MIGKQILHYQILEKLAEGGMGVVYRAQDTRLRRAVAVKMLSDQLLHNNRFRQRFLREAQAAAALEHPNICTIHEINEHEGQLFIVMQLVRGQTVRDALAAGPLEIRRGLRLARQMASGLAHAHQNKIIHRDIKSLNILLTERDEVKILDFGLAKWIEGARTGEWGPSKSISVDATTVGTVSYMSPEQAMGEATDHRSDIFSLGVVLYEMFTARLPFEGDHFLVILHGIVDEDPIPPRALRPELPAALEALILKALEKERAARFQTAEELLQALDSVEQELAPRGVRFPFGSTIPARWAIWGLAALLALLVAAGLLLRPEDVPAPSGPVEQALAAPPRVAITYFDNRTGDGEFDWMTGGAVEALVMGLADSREVRVISTQRLHDLLLAPELQGARRIDRSVAGKLARTAGAETHIYGSISRAPAALRFAVQLEDLRTGTVLDTFHEEVAEAGDLLAVLGGLAGRIRNRLGSSTDPQPLPQVARLFSSSLPATRAYFSGLEKLRLNLKQEALAVFQEAIRLDPNFFLAHYQASQLHLTLRDNAAAIASLRRAAALSEQAGRRERLYLLALQARLVDRDPERALRALQELVAEYPEEVNALSDMALLHRQRREYDLALEACRKAIEVDPYFAPIYANQGYTYLSLNRLEEAVASLQRYTALLPTEANPHDSLGEIYISQRHLADAAREFREALRLEPDFYPSYRGLAYTHALEGRLPEALEAGSAYLQRVRSEASRASARLIVSQLSLAAGRPAEARRHLEGALGAARATGNRLIQALAIAYLADLELEQDDTDAARRQFGQVLELAAAPDVASAEFASLLPASARFGLGLAAVKSGDPAAASVQEKELQRLAVAAAPAASRWLAYLEGIIAGRERDWMGVQVALERAAAPRLAGLNLSRDATVFLHNTPRRFGRFFWSQELTPAARRPSAREGKEIATRMAAVLAAEQRSGRLAIYQPADDFVLGTALEATGDLQAARRVYQRAADALETAERGYTLRTALLQRLALLDRRSQ